MLNPDYLLALFLVFVRIGGLLLSAPFFGQKTLPVRVRVLFAAILAYGIVGLLPDRLPALVYQPAGLAVAIGIEALTGTMLGMAAQMVMWTVSYAADVLGFQMGLSAAQVFDPISGHNANPLANFVSMTLMLVFLLIDGHHHILRALFLSFEVVPLAGAGLQHGGPLMLSWMGAFFETTLRLVAPFMVTYLLVEVSLGLFARLNPQADIFSVGFPLKLLIGLSLVLLFMPNFFPVIPVLVDRMAEYMLALIEALAV